MKKFKALLSLALVLCLMLTLFAACAKTEETPAPSTNSNTTTTPSTPAENTDTEEPAETPDEPEDIDFDDEPTEIYWQFYDLRMTAADYGDHVWDAVNDLLLEKLNVRAIMKPAIAADYNSAFNLTVAGGEQLDLVGLTGRLKCADMFAANQVMDITDLLPQYAPDAYNMMKDYVGALSYDGRIYGIPTNRNFCTNGYIVMRKDILEELDMVEKAQNMTTWSEFEEILAVVTEKYVPQGIYAISKGPQWTIIQEENSKLYNGDNFSDTIVFDNLGDSLYNIYTDTDGNVGCVQFTENYQKECEIVKDWFDKGYVYPDAGLTDVHGDELMKQGVAFATIQPSEVGIEVTKASACGYPLVCTKYYTGMIKTSTLNTWGMAVPITAEEPEAALRVVNLLYTDPTLMNLLIWGVEGTDYDVVDGQVNFREEHHYYEADFMLGNNLLLTPLNGNGADFYERVADTNAHASLSPYLGFAPNTADLDLVISQLTAVKEEYRASIQCGAYTPELYEAYKAKMIAAGIDDYVAAFQTQLDAWLGK